MATTLPPHLADRPGLHHVVLPTPVVHRAKKNPLLQSLFPTDAGLYPKVNGHCVNRPRGAEGNILLVCTGGNGFVRWAGHEERVQPGSVVLLPPNEAHAYGADDENPWTLEWAHFTGTEAAAWRQAVLGSSSASAVVQVPASLSTAIGLARVHEKLETGYDEVQLLAAAAALRSTLTEILRLSRGSEHVPTLLEAIDATAEWMREHLDRRIHLTDLAARAHLSASHYSAVFNRRFGFAPIDWLIRQRIQRACQLLDTTSDKVEVIGRAVGFSDPYYFSRAFRRIMGASPRAYRSVAKG